MQIKSIKSKIAFLNCHTLSDKSKILITNNIGIENKKRIFQNKNGSYQTEFLEIERDFSL
jgi:hypothetical protein